MYAGVRSFGWFFWYKYRLQMIITAVFKYRIKLKKDKEMSLMSIVRAVRVFRNKQFNYWF